MTSTNQDNAIRAAQLHDEGQALSAAGDDDGALQKYREAIALEPGKSASHYNIGLIYKYRNDWEQSLAFNRTASELNPDDEAACWNLAIAATALRDWDSARAAWKAQGIAITGDAGPIEMDFGITPVRLNPDGGAEVVWARRIDPVRARILNIPYTESGFHCGDLVLHDGAAVGYRMHGEQRKPVFNVLELFEASDLQTFEADVEAADEAEMQALDQAFAAADITMEDWTANVQVLCRQCSEGVPHEHHDEEVETPQWQTSRRLGIAAEDWEAARAVLQAWKDGRRNGEAANTAV
ncbi:MAG: tetratricopeptide repeat protein [Duganella sp.]